MSENNKPTCGWGCAMLCVECKNDPSKLKPDTSKGICDWGCAMLCVECRNDPSKRFDSSKNK